MMKIITKITSISLVLFSTQLMAEPAPKVAKIDKTAEAEQKAAREEARFPIGCRPVGYKQHLKVLSLFPGREGALQSLYFFYNQTSQTVSLYHMRDEDSEYSIRMNHAIGPHQWAALATGEPLVKFICALGDNKNAYGKILDCAETVKVCEYVNVKFGLNNKGNFWISEGNSRNGAVNDVVHYGVIPGV